ncbi:hypothetical protein Tfer_0057 [Thermincola ferriacetica]|uniref:Uncharacterized protein n=1 Tax=Thermincola ferriacetica TaxID=281456 RepID=A0A0L6W6J5_9FIRM|nr:outer spore coat protein CotE [Thermincola ferriacetica]KNZ70988.1 hypothetical protein Tfer_0057 [Thermincola ferriacetica]
MTNEPLMREIITKAVCGKGQIQQQNVVNIRVPEPGEVQILGHYVTNARLKSAVPLESVSARKMVKVEGQYDLHVWYAAGQDTNSVKKTIDYIETIPITTFAEEDFNDAQARGEITSRPKCKKAYLTEDGQSKIIRLEIEQGLAVEVIGTTKLFVKTIDFLPQDPYLAGGIELVAPQINTFIQELYPDDICDLEDINEDDYIK